MDNKPMDMMQMFKRNLNMFFSGYYNNSPATREEIVLRLGALMYLRKINALEIKRLSDSFEANELVLKEAVSTDLVLCYNETIMRANAKGAFLQLLERKLFDCMHDGDPDYFMEMSDFLIDWDVDGKGLLNAFDYAVGYGMENHDKYMKQPREITAMVEILLDEKVKTVFDPFGGMMDFATSISDRRFVANEISESIWEVGLFRLALADLLEKTNFNCKNSADWVDGQFDAIVTYPPFGVKLRMKNDYFVTVDSEELPFRYFNTATTENGQLITVVPYVTLISDNDVKVGLREMIVEHNWLDTVIFIPKQKRNGSYVDSAIVVLKKNRASEEGVRFIDATNCFDELNGDYALNMLEVKKLLNKQQDDKYAVTISKEDIIKNHSLWLPGYYLLLNSCTYREGFEYVCFEDVLEPIPARRRFDETSGRFVDRISATVLQYEKTPNDFPVSNDLENTVKITEPVVLISLVSAAFPMYCVASESEPVFVKYSRAIKAYRILSDKIHPGYLCTELFSKLVSLQGYVNFYLQLNKRILGLLPLSFPLFEKDDCYLVQQNLYEATKEANQGAKMRELGLQEYIERKKREYKESIRGRKHAVGQYLSDVSAFWNVLNLFRKEKNGCLLDSDIVDEDYQTTVDDLFCAIDAKLNNALTQFETLLSDENEWEGLDMDEIEPDWFIEEYIEANQDVRFNFVHDHFDLEEYKKMLEEIELEYWGKIVFPKKVLTRVFEDIINNAVEYGFTDVRRKDYKILISQEFVDIDCWEIRIANNGEPAPDSLDPKKVFNLGYTTGSGKGHSGTGAYEVKQLMEMYGGEVEFVSTPNEEYTVTYVLTFKNMK